MLTMLGNSKGEVEKEIGAYKKKKKTNKEQSWKADIEQIDL